MYLLSDWCGYLGRGFVVVGSESCVSPLDFSSQEWNQDFTGVISNNLTRVSGFMLPEKLKFSALGMQFSPPSERFVKI